MVVETIRRPRLTPEDRAAAKLLRERERERIREEKLAAQQQAREEKAVARELAKVQRAIERERLKAERAEARAQELAEAKAAKLAEAQDGLCDLPALVFRDGTVRHCTDAEAWQALSLFFTDMCVDVETSGYWVGHQHYELRTIQMGGEEVAVVFDAADSGQRDIVELALEFSQRLHAHSASADLVPLVNAGLITWADAWGKMEDSVLRAKLVDPALSGSEADALKELAHDLLREYAVSPEAEKRKNALFAAMKCKVKTDVTTPPEDNGWYCVDKRAVTMIRYAGSDVLDLAAVLRVLPPLPVSQEVLDRERRVQGICARAAYAGFPLDLPHIQKKIEEFTENQQRARAKVEELTEGRITNPSSSKDVLALLLERGYDLKLDRKTGQPTAGKESLEPHANRGDELAKNIIEYRHDVTTLGLLLRPLENLCLEGDAIMRPTVYTINAKTGRMSCVRPNGQQFSRQGGIRACVKAWDGTLGISADFSGCEILVAAALSGDKGLYEAETSDTCWKCETAFCGCEKPHTGLHWRVAHAAFGKDARKEDRYNSKRGTFTRLFGGGPGTAADQVGCDIAVMYRVWEAFAEVAPVFTDWDNWLRDRFAAGSMVWRDYATGTNYSQPINGTKHMIYRTYSGRNVYVTKGPHAAGNGAIQGTARELLVDGLLRWEHTQWGSLACLPVHDECVILVPEAEAEEATETLKSCMRTRVLSTPGFEVLVDASSDRPWASWPDSS